nr:hypothetical protein [Escherichia coli]
MIEHWILKEKAAMTDANRK